MTSSSSSPLATNVSTFITKLIIVSRCWLTWSFSYDFAWLLIVASALTTHRHHSLWRQRWALQQLIHQTYFVSVGTMLTMTSPSTYPANDESPPICDSRHISVVGDLFWLASDTLSYRHGRVQKSKGLRVANFLSVKRLWGWGMTNSDNNNLHHMCWLLFKHQQSWHLVPWEQPVNVNFRTAMSYSCAHARAHRSTSLHKRHMLHVSWTFVQLTDYSVVRCEDDLDYSTADIKDWDLYHIWL